MSKAKTISQKLSGTLKSLGVSDKDSKFSFIKEDNMYLWNQGYDEMKELANLGISVNEDDHIEIADLSNSNNDFGTDDLNKAIEFIKNNLKVFSNEDKSRSDNSFSKSLSEIKSKCKTKDQRKAFNELVKTFAKPDLCEKLNQMFISENGGSIFELLDSEGEAKLRKLVDNLVKKNPKITEKDIEPLIFGLPDSEEFDSEDPEYVKYLSKFKGMKEVSDFISELF